MGLRVVGSIADKVLFLHPGEELVEISNQAPEADLDLGTVVAVK
jgi:hypothetical protein